MQGHWPCSAETLLSAKKTLCSSSDITTSSKHLRYCFQREKERETETQHGVCYSSIWVYSWDNLCCVSIICTGVHMCCDIPEEESGPSSRSSCIQVGEHQGVLYIEIYYTIEKPPNSVLKLVYILCRKTYTMTCCTFQRLHRDHHDWHQKIFFATFV